MAYRNTILPSPAPVMLIEWLQISFPERIAWHNKLFFGGETL